MAEGRIAVVEGTTTMIRDEGQKEVVEFGPVAVVHHTLVARPSITARKRSASMARILAPT